MRRFAENIRAADEIAGRPIGERDLAPVRRGIQAADNSIAQNENAAMRVALPEQKITRRKTNGFTRCNDSLRFLLGQRRENIGDTGKIGSASKSNSDVLGCGREASASSVPNCLSAIAVTHPAPGTAFVWAEQGLKIPHQVIKSIDLMD